jgi:hypothetical protein
MAKSEKEIQELLAQMEALKAELETEKTARSAAEKMAHTMAAFGSSEEQATGKTLKVNVCVNPEERDVKKQTWKEIDFPLYAYRIDIPAGFGIELKTNGRSYYHGETYEFTARGLSDIKSRIARCWDHEKSIHGDNVNAYRRQREDYAR